MGGTNEYLTYEALDYLLTTILGSGGLTLEDGYSYLSDERPGCPDVREMLAAGRTPAFIAADIVCTVPKTDGYTVMQGGGTDGTYAFFGMIDSSQDPSLVRLYKYSLADWSQVLVSEPIELAHCNDITYDSVNKRLVISRCTKTDGYLGLNFVDPETLQLTGSAETAFRQSRVAYLPESDGYVFGMEGKPTVTRTDAAFNPISTFETPLTDKISQGFFWDGQYIYDIRYYSGSASHPHGDRHAGRRKRGHRDAQRRRRRAGEHLPSGRHVLPRLQPHVVRLFARPRPGRLVAELRKHA